MLALNHSLMRLSIVVAPVLPLGGDAESSARNIKAPCRQSTSRQHVVGGICVIAGQRVFADPAMQIAVAQNSTESAAKYVCILDGVTPTPGTTPSSTQIAAPVAAERQVQARLVVALNQCEPTG
jgi:hypothetical protein